MSLPDIADLITAWERDHPAEDRLERRLQIYNSLHHDHLPVLRKADVVTYEPDEELVGLGASSQAYKSTLETEFCDEITTVVQNSYRF